MNTFSSRTNSSHELLLSFLVALASLATLAGCATHDQQPQKPQAGSGIAEYQEIVGGSLKAIDATLSALNSVGTQGSPCPPAIMAGFSNEVQHLEVESIRVRARAQAIQNRGDAYFQNWQENMKEVKDAKVRELAEKNRSELETSFRHIKVEAQRTRTEFNPFLADLRKLRSSLEKDPANSGLESNKQLIRSLEERGRSVKDGLNSVGTELARMKALITPAK